MTNETPRGQTPGIVTGLATESGVLETTGPSLIGLFGPKDRMSAMFRLGNGAIRTVAHGQLLGAGRVIGIDQTGVRVRRNGAVRHYRMPGS